MPLAVTVDVEWAKEDDIKAIFALADAHSVPLFPFVTHESAFLKQRGGAQGIHPNFLLGSTQGNTEDEVIEECFRLVPNARAFRSHCFYSHTRLLWAMAERGIMADANLLSYLQYRQPFKNAGGFTTFPTYWSDDVAKRNGDTRLEKRRMHGTAVLVVNVHPTNHAYVPTIELFETARAHSIPFEMLYSD